MFLSPDAFQTPTDQLSIPSNDEYHPLTEDFRQFIGEASFPCVGAKSALSRGRLTAIVAEDIDRSTDDRRIHGALLAFIAQYRTDPTLFQSFAVIFQRPLQLNEKSFECALWARIQSLCDKDAEVGHPWDDRVSSDPNNPHFSLSVAGEAFFVVGLHPNASRPARRFRAPALVFNLHDQFERLREEGRYEKLRASIMGRDEALAGSANPMLAKHGEVSEARQYSGRAVSEEWRCPFEPFQKADQATTSKSEGPGK